MRYPFIVLIEQSWLRTRVIQLLHDLSMLSEAPTLNLEAGVSRGKSEDKPPPGVWKHGKDASLHEYYITRFSRAQEQIDFEHICESAERDLEFHRKGLPLERVRARAEADEARDIRWVIDNAEGLHCAVIAARQGWPVSWVKKKREDNGRDPIYGYERPDFRGMSKEDRRNLAAKLKAEGLSIREAATRVGVSKTMMVLSWD